MSAHAAVAEYETTGIPNGKLGIWLFLASEIMLFGTLFTSYIVLRTASASWPRGWEALNVPLATLNTVILITSSVTMVMAYAKAYERSVAGFKLFQSLTILLGCAFLVVKGFEYSAHFAHNEWPSTSIFNAIYFTTTGLHMFHVIGGIGLNSVLLLRQRTDWDHPLFIGRIEYAGLYWHFVDIVWIFLFPALYLL